MSGKDLMPSLSTTVTLKLAKLMIKRFWISLTHFLKISYASSWVISVRQTKYQSDPQNETIENSTHSDDDIDQKY